ncbi:MAG: DUF4328 domain-containing protein [Methylacidiphilales bacterium]|nr:DUF4328 domain-containing protein [Candidatus Methylacidiphilales bacterium]
MSTIQIATATGQHLPYDEKQVRNMLRQGLLKPEALYWKEGMTEWRPLKELPGVASGSALAPATRYQFAKNPEPLTTVLLVFWGISFLFAIPFLLLSVAMLIETFLQDFKSLVVISRWVQVLGYASMAIYLPTLILFLIWIYRANVNCRGFGAQLKISPAMTVGSFFIPFINLVYPCVALQEIWKASRNPAQWQTERASILIGFWWGFWLLHAVLGPVLSLYAKMHVVKGLPAITAKLQAISILLMTASIFKIILCLLAFAMIYLITSRQKTLVGQNPF